MKAHKVELLVLEHDYMEPLSKSNFECSSGYYNPTVMSIQSAEIGEWYDEHPLNYDTTREKYFYKLFHPES